MSVVGFWICSLDYPALHLIVLQLREAIYMRDWRELLKNNLVPSYLSEPKAHSRAGGHFFLFLSSDTTIPPNNGAVLNVVHIIKNVMPSATKAELVGLYIVVGEAVYIRIILEELGHKQPHLPYANTN